MAKKNKPAVSSAPSDPSSLASPPNPSTPASASIGLAPWISEFIELFSSAAAHCFLLHGEVHGRGTGAKHLDSLQRLLAERFALVVRYDLEAGITFLTDSMREQALHLLSHLSVSSVALPDLFGSATPPLEALCLIESLLRHQQCREKVAVFLDYAEMICPMREKGQMSEEERAVLVKLLKWGRDEQLMRSGNPVFFIAQNSYELHADLLASSTGIARIEIPAPTLLERERFLEWYLRDREEEGRPIVLRLPIAELAHQTPGLSLWHLEDLLLLGARRGGVSRALVKEQKQAVISAQYQGVGALVDPLPAGFDALGGMGHLISWVEDELLVPLRLGRVQDVPKGILLVGPPGNGKTLFMQALAAELGFNAVSLRMEHILGGIVGESERKLQMLFRLVERLAPALLLFDEADQSDLARRGQGSGNPVASNLFGQMLQFVGDESKRGQVILVMASNRPDLFDPALLRSGRIDAVIPILNPTAVARGSILMTSARKLGVELTEQARAMLVERTDGASGADLAALIRKASRLARRNQSQRITAEDASLALSFIRLSSLQQTEQYTQLALKYCSDSELLSPEQRPRCGEVLSAPTQSRQEREAASLWREARDW